MRISAAATCFVSWSTSRCASAACCFHSSSRRWNVASRPADADAASAACARAWLADAKPLAAPLVSMPPYFIAVGAPSWGSRLSDRPHELNDRLDLVQRGDEVPRDLLRPLPPAEAGLRQPAGVVAAVLGRLLLEQEPVAGLLRSVDLELLDAACAASAGAARGSSAGWRASPRRASRARRAAAPPKLSTVLAYWRAFSSRYVNR